jgi:hypothetical protein
MADETAVGSEQTPAKPEQAVQAARDALDSIRALFEHLVPPESVVVRDVFGSEHPLRARLPARAQILVLRQLDALSSEDATEIRSQLTPGAGMAAVVLAVARAAAKESVMAALAHAFEAAHPGAVRAARERARQEGIEAKDAADLFGAEEMVAGLLPFSLGLLRRLVGLLSEMAPAKPPAP